jgi:outer membrane receptor protein involved in Fe transport
VYGSDAITGVVNFILDKNFNGFKYEANAGISQYADGFKYKVNAAAGMDVFGGRGHIEGAIEYRNGDGVVQSARRIFANGYSSYNTGNTPNNPVTNEQRQQWQDRARLATCWNKLRVSGTRSAPAAHPQSRHPAGQPPSQSAAMAPLSE